MYDCIYVPILKFDDRFARQNRIRASTRVSPGFTLLKHSSPSVIDSTEKSQKNKQEIC